MLRLIAASLSIHPPRNKSRHDGNNYRQTNSANWRYSRLNQGSGFFPVNPTPHPLFPYKILSGVYSLKNIVKCVMPFDTYLIIGAVF